MPFQIEYDPANDLLRAHVSGQIGIGERAEMARVLMEQAATRSVHGLLLDFREAQAPTPTQEEAGRFADLYAPLLQAPRRLAYLLRYEHQLDTVVEDVLRARGVVVERFREPEVAIAWLREARPPRHPSQGPGADDPRAPLMRTAVGDEDGPGVLTPDQFAALGELVDALLAADVDAETIRGLVARMAAAMRSGSAP